jgi:hypothetical protein
MVIKLDSDELPLESTSLQVYIQEGAITGWFSVEVYNLGGRIGKPFH